MKSICFCHNWHWPAVHANNVGFVAVTTRWRSDSHDITLLDVTEGKMSYQMEIGKLSRSRVQLSLAPAKGRFQSPATDHMKVKRKTSRQTCKHYSRSVEASSSALYLASSNALAASAHADTASALELALSYVEHQYCRYTDRCDDYAALLQHCIVKQV
ncbi:hypothetical protein AVEN_232394-1 [Araneus ventricosus]|uniref:Uncharacterized protein n=1 Tax=Araneus ventricosus TaxID=182803 RepID=A0A4Y2CVT7_ARAVE|nr:hypothetical protein AVEN_232394-1 [Araneus ventricosus]